MKVQHFYGAIALGMMILAIGMLYTGFDTWIGWFCAGIGFCLASMEAAERELITTRALNSVSEPTSRP